MRSTSSDIARVLAAAALAAAAGACTDFAGPIPGTEPEVMVQPNAGTGGTGSPSAGTGGSGVPSGGTGGTGAAPPPGGDVVSFDEEVHPILVTMCGECHSEPAGGLPGHGAADADASFAEVTRVSGSERVYDRILARAAGIDGFMPPGYIGCEGPLGSMGCLSQQEYDTIALWVEQGAMNR